MGLIYRFSHYERRTTQAIIFGCLPPCVELPATEGYVCTVSGNLHTRRKMFLLTESFRVI